jgi:hypothetical protein
MKEHVMRKKWIWIAPLAIVGMAAFIWIGGELVMHLWNWLAPTLFGFRQISIWQAVGLLALCRILVGGFGCGGGQRSGMRRKMRDRWEQMTPDEREKFRQAMRDRWGAVGASGRGRDEPA